MEYYILKLGLSEIYIYIYIYNYILLPNLRSIFKQFCIIKVELVKVISLRCDYSENAGKDAFDKL